jgi:hypothetical protein
VDRRIHQATLVAIALLAFVSCVAALAQAAAAGSHCTVTVDGQALGSEQTPLRIPADATVNVEVTSVAPIQSADVALMFGDSPIPVPHEPFARRTGTEWEGPVTLRDYTSIATGKYELLIVVNGEVCARGWAVITGRSPLETPVGLGAAGSAAGGAVWSLWSLLRVLRGASVGWSSFASGALAGGGALVFSQQSGVASITPMSLLTWTVGPGAVSSVAQLVASKVAKSLAGPPSTPPLRPTIDLDVRVPSGDTDAAGARPGTAGASLDTSGAAPTAEAEREPELPRESYARLDCPEAVVERSEFEVVVGLMERPDPRVAGGPLRLPDWISGPYTMTVQVVADGFALRPGESWRLELPVSGRDPYPSRALHLTAEAGTLPVRAASIRAMYSVAGQPIGLAVRAVAVVRHATLLGEAPREPAGPAVALAFPDAQTAPDLTVRIERADSQASGRLLVQLLTADQTIPLPDAPIAVDIGGDPARDLRRLIATLSKEEGKPTQFVTLRGIGLTIREQLPRAFWDVLREVALRVKGRAPTILFLSAEPYVPWELAVVDPPLDPDAPPFLSAQANVGRWVLGQSRPKLPPPAAHAVSAFAVVSGRYDLPGWARLVEAEAEAAELARELSASSVDATTAKVLELLGGRPEADLIHFAVHGNFDSEGIDDGLILVDGSALGPLAIRGTPLRGTPFVFLNACQVGRGQQILGDHAGLAEAFLFAGAAGVIAPLWSVDDTVARTIALRFYKGFLAGESAADILRRERRAFRDSPATSSTYLAYQYFGHPALRLERPANVTRDAPTAVSSVARAVEVIG